MAINKWTGYESNPVKRAEQYKQGRARIFRLRWFGTILYGIGLFMMGRILWRERLHWPSLLHVYTWAHPLSGDALPVFVFTCAALLTILSMLWQQVGQYKQEQAALEQQRLMQDAANAPGVWPPPPRTPDE